MRRPPKAEVVTLSKAGAGYSVKTNKKGIKNMSETPYSLLKKLTMKQEEINPAVWYVYEGDTKLCITNEANALFFVTLCNAYAEQAAELDEAREALKPFIGWANGDRSFLLDSQGRYVTRVSEAEYERAAAVLAKHGG